MKMDSIELTGAVGLRWIGVERTTLVGVMC